MRHGKQRYRDGISLLFPLFFIICHPYIPLHLEEMIFYTCFYFNSLETLLSGEVDADIFSQNKERMQRLLLIDLLGDNSTPLIDSVIASVKQVNWHMYCLCIVNVSHVYRHISVCCAHVQCAYYICLYCSLVFIILCLNYFRPHGTFGR